MYLKTAVAVIASALVMTGCASTHTTGPGSHPVPATSKPAGANLAGIPVPTMGSDGIYHFNFPASVNVTGKMCGKDTPQFDQRLKDMGVVRGTAGMIALDGGDNAPGTMTICALGY